MDLELKHLGQTLASGGIALHGLISWLKIVRTKPLSNAWADPAEKVGIQMIAVYLALVLTLGLFTEDYSKGVAAARAGRVFSAMECVIDTDKQLRLRSLFSDVEHSPSRITGNLSAIVREMLDSRRIDVELKQCLLPIRKGIVNGAGGERHLDVPEQDVKRFEGAVNDVYYFTKNRVFRDPQYFAELQDLQSRADFARSMVFLCSLLGLAFALVAIASFVRPVASALKLPENARKTALFFALAYAGGVLVGGAAYRAEQGAFNLRTYGYYLSLNTERELGPEKEK